MGARPELLRDLRQALYDQLPAQLQDEFTIEVAADAYFLRAMAMFVTTDGRSFSTELAGLPLKPRIPDAFLAWLCVQPETRPSGQRT